MNGIFLFRSASLLMMAELNSIVANCTWENLISSRSEDAFTQLSSKSDVRKKFVS